MSRSIHITVKEVTRRNAKSDLTADNPDAMDLAKKERFKQAEQQKRARARAANKPNQ